MIAVAPGARGLVVGGRWRMRYRPSPATIRDILNRHTPPDVLIIALAPRTAGERELYVVVKAPPTRILFITGEGVATECPAGFAQHWDWHIFSDYDAAHAAFSLGYAEEPQGE